MTRTRIYSIVLPSVAAASSAVAAVAWTAWLRDRHLVSFAEAWAAGYRAAH